AGIDFTGSFPRQITHRSKLINRKDTLITADSSLFKNERSSARDQDDQRDQPQQRQGKEQADRGRDHVEYSLGIMVGRCPRKLKPRLNRPERINGMERHLPPMSFIKRFERDR